MNMKHLSILMASLLVIGSNAQTNIVAITEDQNGQTIKVQKTDDVVVTFVAASGTGYQWAMEPNDFATTKEEDVTLKPGLPGGPVKMMFHVKAKQTVTLKFDFSRAWEKDKPAAKTFSVTLQVQ